MGENVYLLSCTAGDPSLPFIQLLWAGCSGATQLTLGKTWDTPVIVLNPSQSSSFVVRSLHTHECNFNLGLLIWGFLSLATLHIDQTLLEAINKLLV